MMNSVIPVTPVSAAPSSAAERDLVGEFVGKYRVVRKLGRGGMGTVYEAVHSDIGQRVAVKILNADMSEKPSFVRRFFDEARLVSMVDHPGLVKIFDFNQLPDGTLYILMEYLEGQSLWERFCATRGRHGIPGLPTAQAVRFTRQLASALVAVHEKGIVHRDLKPDNVILVADPETPRGERVKLLDFGIAKQGVEDGGERHTAAGIALGTPTYMSPEQCESQPKLSDRADVYALGVMLFELLAGAPPFQAKSMSAVMRQHLIKPTPPLPEHVPQAVASLVGAMLEKEPQRRPSMAEVVERIDALATQSSLSSDVVKRRRTAFILAAAGLVALLALLLLLLLLLLRGRGRVDKIELTPPPRGTQPVEIKDVLPSKPVPDAARGTAESPVLPATPQKSKPPGKSHGPGRILFGTKKSSKKNHP